MDSVLGLNLSSRPKPPFLLDTSSCNFHETPISSPNEMTNDSEAHFCHDVTQITRIETYADTRETQTRSLINWMSSDTHLQQTLGLLDLSFLLKIALLIAQKILPETGVNCFRGALSPPLSTLNASKKIQEEQESKWSSIIDEIARHNLIHLYPRLYTSFFLGTKTHSFLLSQLQNRIRAFDQIEPSLVDISDRPLSFPSIPSLQDIPFPPPPLPKTSVWIYSTLEYTLSELYDIYAKLQQATLFFTDHFLYYTVSLNRYHHRRQIAEHTFIVLLEALISSDDLLRNDWLSQLSILFQRVNNSAYTVQSIDFLLHAYSPLNYTMKCLLERLKKRFDSSVELVQDLQKKYTKFSAQLEILRDLKNQYQEDFIRFRSLRNVLEIALSPDTTLLKFSSNFDLNNCFQTIIKILSSINASFHREKIKSETNGVVDNVINWIDSSLYGKLLYTKEALSTFEQILTATMKQLIQSHSFTSSLNKNLLAAIYFFIPDNKCFMEAIELLKKLLASLSSSMKSLISLEQFSILEEQVDILITLISRHRGRWQGCHFACDPRLKEAAKLYGSPHKTISDSIRLFLEFHT